MKMRSHIACQSLIACLFPLLCSSPCSAWQAQDTASSEQSADTKTNILKREQSRFLRVLTDEYREPTALQTATTRYVLKDDAGNVKLEVFLEGVVHIADASYYRAFAKRLEHYDCVLFEMIQPSKDGETSDEQPEKEESDAPSALRMFLQLSAGSLGLVYQIEEFDYEGDKFVHSDLSPSEIAERIEERGEDVATMLADLLIQLTRQIMEASNEAKSESQEVTKGLDWSILTDPNGIMKIRRLLAMTLGESEHLDSALPSSLHRILIVDRNDRALEVFQQELDKGKRRIAFLWGAGHMADFEQRLILDYGMEKAEVHWRNAWDLRDGAVEGAPLGGLLESVFRDSFKEKLRKLIETAGKKDDG